MASPASSPVEAKRELERRRAAGTPQPSPLPRSLPLSDIETCEDAFQHRDILPALSDSHTRDLAKVAERGTPLTPIRIWWAGNGWVCLDGHHRRAAYALAKWTRRVPVKVFEGDTEQAIAAALEDNSKAVLPMVPQERTRAAWRLVNTCESLSKAQQALAAGVSARLIANMRRVRRVLMERSAASDPSGMQWASALREEKHGPYGESQHGPYADGEDYEWEECEKLRPVLAKALGQLPLRHHRYPIVAQTLLGLAPQLADWIARQGGYHRKDDFSGDEEEDF